MDPNQKKRYIVNGPESEFEKIEQRNKYLKNIIKLIIFVFVLYTLIQLEVPNGILSIALKLFAK